MKSPNVVMAIFLLSLGAVPISSKRIPAFAGPYRLISRRLDNVSQYYKSTGKIWLRLDATQVRGRQPMYIWGSAFSSIPVTDEMKVEVMLASRSNNQWKKNAFIFKFDRICTNSKTYGETILAVFYGKDYDTSCPIKPFGYKEIRNHTYEFEFPKIPVMPYGRYLLNFAVLLKDDIVGVGVADCEIVPKV